MNLGRVSCSDICGRFFQTTTKLLVRGYNGNPLFRSCSIRSLSTESNNDCQQTFARVVVSDVIQLSPRVRGITLKATCDQILQLRFKAGQWIDMKISGVERIGGFSICNAPDDFMTSQCLQLAVQQNDNVGSPAHWCATQCKVGDVVKVRVGGEFFYDDNDDVTLRHRPLLLIAGGVGINPLHSILLHRSYSNDDVTAPTRLLFAAKRREDLLFEETIVKICEENFKFHSKFYLTDEKSSKKSEKGSPNMSSSEEGSSNVSYLFRRLENTDIQESVCDLRKSQSCDDVICFICGPPLFIESCEKILMKMGIKKHSIKYEKWW